MQLIKLLCLTACASLIASAVPAHDIDKPHRHTTRAEIEKRKQARIEQFHTRQKQTSTTAPTATNEEPFVEPPPGHTNDHAHDGEGYDVDANGRRNLKNGRHEKPKERRARRKAEAKALRENRRENFDKRVEEAKRRREERRERQKNR